MLSVHSSPLGELGTKDTGGMSIYIRELAYELGKQGHLVDIYTRQQHHSGRQIQHLSDNVSLIHIKAGLSGYIQKLDLYPFLPDFFQNMEEFRIREGRRYDIVHSNYWLSGRVGTWAQVYWHVPHFVLFHTLGSVKNMFSIGDPEPELRIAIEKQVSKTCTRILAETDRERRQLIQLYDAESDKISVVPCGVNDGIFRPLHKEHSREQLGIVKNELILLYVGRIDPLKGIDRLITACSYLQHHRHLRLLIVGGESSETAYFRSLQNLSVNLGLQNRVTFIGRTDHQNLPLYYSAADALVLPSHTESFGLVALESLACGTPVVATRVGAMDKIIISGRNGYLADSADPHLLAQEIKRLIAALRAGKLSRTAIRQSVENYRWSKVAMMMVNEYTKAVRHDHFRFLPESRAQAPLYAS
jgi:D-inositol-3-phosphate glycosyltransferase